MTEPAVFALGELRQGVTAAFDFSIDQQQMDAFAAISGDENPLHRDAAFAAGRGFAGCVVYGGLLIAKVSRMIGMELPGRDSVWSSLQMQFVSPLIVGEPARLEATVSHQSVAARAVTLQLKVTAGGRTVSHGKALVSLP